MADPRFFEKSSALKIKEIAEFTGAELQATDPDLLIEDVAPLDTACGSDLSFLDNIKYKHQYTDTKAGACFVHPEHVKDAPEDIALLVSKSPYKAYALTAQKFYPDAKHAKKIADMCI